MNEAKYPDVPGAKTHDPDTSMEAATAIKDRAVILRERCRDELKARDLTADEIAERLGESVLSIRPRISELYKRARVWPTGERRKNKSGKSAVVWRLMRAEVQPELGME